MKNKKPKYTMGQKEKLFQRKSKRQFKERTTFSVYKLFRNAG